MLDDETVDPSKFHIREGAGGYPSSIVVPRFDPDRHIPPSPNIDLSKGGVKILVIGAPGSGKSHFIRWLVLSKAHRIPAAVAFNGTEAQTGFYSTFIPPAYCYTSCDPEDLQRVMDERRHASRPGGNTDINRWLALVIDDCASQLKGMTAKSPDGRLHAELLKNGRHMNMMLVVGIQDIKDYPKNLRTSFDFAVIFAISSNDRRRDAFNEFGGAFGTYQQFEPVFNAITAKKHRAIVIRANAALEDSVWWAEAAPFTGATKFGSAEYRCMARAIFDPVRAKADHGFLGATVKKTKFIEENRVYLSDDE